MSIDTVGVVGVGTMGSGIASVFALGGHKVVLHDSKPDAAALALETIAASLERQVAKKRVTDAEREAALARTEFVAGLDAFGECDLVIESVVEDESVKIGVIQRLSEVAKESAILATNTSTISVTRLAAVTRHPERFMGVHFMNPPQVMELVELIRGIATHEDTFKTVREVVEGLGKTVTTAEDFPGFIVNRVLVPMINEAVYTLYEGVGTVDGIDLALRLGARHPMGPFQLADFIGLDTCLAIMNALHAGLSDTKYRPCPLLVKYVEAGWLGCKTQLGFYDYRGDEPVPTR